MGFSVKVPSSAVRSAEFHAEISEIYLQLHNDVQHIGTSTDSEASTHTVSVLVCLQILSSIQYLTGGRVQSRAGSS